MSSQTASPLPLIQWSENGNERSACWRSERGLSPPKTVLATDDRISADQAYGLAGQGIGLLWRSDFQNARQLLNALAARADRRARHRLPTVTGRLEPAAAADLFHRVRQGRSQRARTLGMLLIELDADYGIALRRAPDVREACLHAWGPLVAPTVLSLRELLGVIGAHQWLLRGIEHPSVGGRIHPHYGVFAPTRTEYVDLVATTPLPAACSTYGATVFDVGTGTGVLAAVLARRGATRIIATDTDPRAIACAKDNIARLGLASCIVLQQRDTFPDGRADLVICNPPWVPARPGSPLEHGIYDDNSSMLRGFVSGLADHLNPGGEGWLILSDLAEHLGLRSRADLLALFDSAGLEPAGRHDARPRHPKAADPNDPLHHARRLERTSLWRLRHKQSAL